ncbi:BppU family phage baseplate upper protein [Clostridium nigeriense]|uniref:BppU family phage baseplate upper protein n=1 Tax=Clostridium nigeriense TaxID=1805470 RepID=UPI003D352B1A
MASKIVVNLDTSKENYIVAKCKQNDDLTLEANIFENGEPLDLVNKEITIQALKADNTYVIQNTDIVKEENKINANLVKDFSRVPGTTKIEVVLVESSKQNTTFSFYLEVVGSVIRGAIESSDSITALEKVQDAAIEIKKINQETQTIVENAGAASKEDFNKVNTQLADITNNVANNRPFKPKVYAYLSQGGSRSQDTYGTQESWAIDCQSFVKAGITDIALSVQIQPLKANRDDFIAGKITANQLEWKTYPTLGKVREMVAVAKQFGLNLYIIKMQDTFIKEQESAGRLKFSDYATAYHNLTMEFANSELEVEWLTIYNEHWTVINVESNYEIIKNTLVAVKGANRKTGFSGVPDVDDFYTDYIDGWMPHYYPSISWKKQNTTWEDGIYGWLGLANHIGDTPLEEVQRKKRKYPNKKVLITEIGCSHYWEDLLAPAIYSSTGTPDEKGMPTAIFLNGFFEVFRNEDFDSVGLYYTNPLREEPIKILRKEMGVV